MAERLSESDRYHRPAHCPQPLCADAIDTKFPGVQGHICFRKYQGKYLDAQLGLPRGWRQWNRGEDRVLRPDLELLYRFHSADEMGNQQGGYQEGYYLRYYDRKRAAKGDPDLEVLSH